MEKFLFFNDGDNDAIAYPLSNMLSLTHEGNTTVEFRFKSSKPLSPRVNATPTLAAITISDQSTDDVSVSAAQAASVSAGVVAYDKVVLTITAGTLALDVMKTLVETINSGPKTDGFITICDDVNSIQLLSSIESCAITQASA